MATNGNATTTGQKPAFDANFTPNVIKSIGPNATPRARQVFTSLFKHVHDFAREVELTFDEWHLGMKFLDEVGHIYFTSNKTRHEMHRISDVIGLESLLVEIAFKHASATGEEPTSSSILGPFWSPDAPFRQNGDSIIVSPHKGQVTLMHGVVTDLDTKKGIPNAVVDIWQASSNGKYDFQDPENQEPNNLRGKFRTDDQGRYWYYCLKPTAYSLPKDGPSYDLIQALDRHTMRPAHIHMMVTAPGYTQVTTQLYPADDPWLETDTVFAVKGDLVVDFTPAKEGEKTAELDMEYNFSLAPKSEQPAVATSSEQVEGAGNEAAAATKL